jgi:hypothetical protein
VWKNRASCHQKPPSGGYPQISQITQIREIHIECTVDDFGHSNVIANPATLHQMRSNIPVHLAKERFWSK